MTLPHANSLDLAIGQDDFAIDSEESTIDLEDSAICQQDSAPLPPLPLTPAPQAIGPAPLFALNTALPRSPSLFSPPPALPFPALPPPPRPLFSSLFNLSAPLFDPNAVPFAPPFGSLVPPSATPITVSCHFDLWTTGGAAATKKEAKDLVLLAVKEEPKLLSHLREIGCVSLKIINGFHVSEDFRNHLTIHKLDSRGDRLGCPLHVFRDGKEPRYSLYPPTERRGSLSSSRRRSSASMNLERVSGAGNLVRGPSAGGLPERRPSTRERQPEGGGVGRATSTRGRRPSRARGGSGSLGGSRGGSEVVGGSL